MFFKNRLLPAGTIWGLVPFLVFSAIFGCAGVLKKTKPAKEKIPYKAMQRPQVMHEEGSLWEDNGPLSDLFIDTKAKNVGDVVTIKILESASASNNAATKTGRKSSVSGAIENFLGYERQFSTPKHQLNPFGSIKGGLQTDFDGSGSTKRSGDLSAYITARVTEVLPNGNLRLEGSREVTVNNEKQLITLSGIVRPRDISPDNVVLSTYISDAQIRYSGRGILDDRQHPGWLANILNIVWPL